MRLIDADALKDKCYITINGTTIGRNNYVMFHEIDDAPTIDAVEVVRCKDCVYWKYRTNYKGDEWGACLFIEELEDDEHWTEDTAFCSCGERSEE